MEPDTDIAALRRQVRMGINIISIIPIGLAIFMVAKNPDIFAYCFTSALGIAGIILFVALIVIQRVWLRHYLTQFEKEMALLSPPVGYAAGAKVASRYGAKFVIPMVLIGFPAIFLLTLGPIYLKIMADL